MALRCFLAAILAAGVLTASTEAAARTDGEPATRAEVIAEQQAAKAKTAAPEQPSAAEAVVRRAQSVLVDQPGGFYPIVDSVRGGGGFAVGGGYRQYYGGNTWWDARGLYSIRGYKLVELRTASAADTAGPRRLRLSARAGWRDVTRLAYYGLGMDTSADDRTNSRVQETYAGGSVEARPHPWVALHGEADFERYVLRAGQGAHPSTDAVRAAADAPGLGRDATFLQVGGGGAFDWRRSPGYTRTGGFYGAKVRAWVDPDDTFSFEQLDVDLIQHVPLLRENWVLAFRGRLQTILDDGDAAPFYLLPSLGSGRTLRGYSTDRFRDRHSLLVSAEWRWIPNRHFVDMSLFFDAGKVTGRRADLHFREMRANWGFGARFHGPDATMLRMEAAKGREGWNLVFSASPPF